MSAAGFAREAASGRARFCAAAASALTFAAVGALFSVSSLALNNIGSSYESAGGAFYEKIHPASWLAFAALLFHALSHPSPRAFFGEALNAYPGLLVYFLAFAALLQHIIFAQRVAFTPILDTFLAPAALFLCLAHSAPERRRTLALLLHVAMLANAALGLYEFLSGWRLTAFAEVFGDASSEPDWRSSALLGHPLTNAMTTGVYALTLAQGGGWRMPAALRPPALALQCLAMVVFGGRAALVILAALLVVSLCLSLWRGSLGARVNLLQAALVLAALPLAAVLLDQAFATGFFDRLIERFTDDKGSAQSRLVLTQILSQFSWSELLIGPDPGKLATLQEMEGVEFGIESFWIGFVLAYGLVASCFFFIGLAFYCRELLRATGRGAWLVLLFYIAVASTSVSISAKTLTLAQLTVILLLCLPRQARPTARFADA